MKKINVWYGKLIIFMKKEVLFLYFLKRQLLNKIGLFLFCQKDMFLQTVDYFLGIHKVYINFHQLLGALQVKQMLSI